MSSRMLLLGACAALLAPGRAQVQVTDLEHRVVSKAVDNFAVDCGGHFAESCTVCPGNNGPLWCNGDCLWTHQDCKPATLWNRFVKMTYDSFWKVIYYLPLILLAALVMTAYAVVYKKKIVDKIPNTVGEAKEDFDSWKEPKFNLFDCFKHPNQCMWATFCTPVVAAKNYDRGSVLPFWQSCALVFCGITIFFWPIFCCLAAVRASLSGKLSKNLGYEPNFFKAWCLTLWCYPCDVGRESLEVDEDLHIKTKCPFEVEVTLQAKFEGAAEKSGRVCASRLCPGSQE